MTKENKTLRVAKKRDPLSFIRTIYTYINSYLTEMTPWKQQYSSDLIPKRSRPLNTHWTEEP